MDQPVTIGLDLAKSVFQVHGVDRDGDGRTFAEERTERLGEPTPTPEDPAA